MVSANNFLVVYLGLELMTLSLYALIALRRDARRRDRSGDEVLRARRAGVSGFLLYGLSMMYGATGSLDITEVFKAIGTGQINRAVLSSAWSSSSPAWRSSWARCRSTCGCPTSIRARRRR